jgi:hypothetical protein
MSQESRLPLLSVAALGGRFFISISLLYFPPQRLLGVEAVEDRQIPRHDEDDLCTTLKNSGVDCGRLPQSCRNPDWQLVLRRQEVGALALIYRKHV